MTRSLLCHWQMIDTVYHLLGRPVEPLKTRRSQELEPALRALLDLIAAEVAHEYVRLMEAAAGKDNPATHGGET